MPNAREVRQSALKGFQLFEAYALLVLQVLCALYAKTLAALQRLPTDALYRKQTEQIVQQKLQITQAVSVQPSSKSRPSPPNELNHVLLKDTDVSAIEEKIGCGQAEELIDQVNVPMHLGALYLERKLWDWKVDAFRIF